MYVCMCIHVLMFTYGGLNRTSNVSVCCFSPYSLKAGSPSLNLELAISARLAGQPAPRICLSQHLNPEAQACVTLFNVCMNAKYSNPGPHTH